MNVEMIDEKSEARGTAVTVLLWTAQVAAAAMFLMACGSKLAGDPTFQLDPGW